jgi:methylmalonyl-CoA mutase N-terminal domain/subunit
VDSFAGRISFFFSSHNNFLEEVAKFRAGRRLWANIMRDKFKAKNPRSLMMRFHTQTAGVTLTAQQPDNNVVRTTVQALAAVLGGTQSLHVNSKDEALALPSEQAAQLSLRTQQIIANESGVIDVADPLGGSYFLESLTDEIENQARNYIQIISDRGGAVSSIKQGYQMQVIQESAYAHQKQVENNEKIIVGINEYAEPDTKPTTLQIDPSAEEKQVEQLRDIKQKRDLSKVKRSLMLLHDVATTDDNTMPATLECVENYCTIGEISNILRGVFGEHQQLRTL